MVALALYATDPAARRQLERLAGGQPDITIVGAADSPAALARLLDGTGVEVVLANAVPQAAAQRAAIVVIADDTAGDGALDVLYAGAQAVLPRDIAAGALAAAIAAAANGMALLPRPLLTLLLAAERAGPVPADGEEPESLLTRRELQVLAAMADGASNKAIARRLGISFHTVKFHVASILAKLDADTRTEAVAHAARLGLVML